MKRMNEETIERAGKVLMAITVVEAAAIDLLDTLNDQREVLRNLIENGGDST